MDTTSAWGYLSDRKLRKDAGKEWGVRGTGYETENKINKKGKDVYIYIYI
jgi:hypothetical protein